MSDQYFFILQLLIAVLLPIIPSVILFKYLPTDATVEGPYKGMKTKFKGAFAGYFIILLVIGGLIELNTPSIPFEVWHITGNAVLQDGEQLLPTDISINPPNVNVSKAGTFYLDIPVGKKDGNVLHFPTISLAHQGFNSVDIPLDDNPKTLLGRRPIEIKKDPATKSIVINNLNLNRMAPYNRGGVP